MTKEIAKKVDTQIAVDAPDQTHVTVDLLSRYLSTSGLAGNLNDQEKEYFVQVAGAFKLNPFKREIYCVPFKEKKSDGTYERHLSIITGYEVYLKRAERIGRLNGWNVKTEGSGETMRAVITIHRKDWAHPFTHEVIFREYNRDNRMWKKSPITMLKKVIIAQGFRMAFPDEFGGMPYIEEELPDDQVGRDIPAYDPVPQTSSDIPADIDRVKDLPENIMQGFEILGYPALTMYHFCEKFGWDIPRVSAELNRIIDMRETGSIEPEPEPQDQNGEHVLAPGEEIPKWYWAKAAADKKAFIPAGHRAQKGEDGKWRVVKQ